MAREGPTRDLSGLRRRLGTGSVLLTAVALGVLGRELSLRLRPADAPLREIVLARERWLGREVRVRGRVRAFEAGTPREYFVVDDDGFRVGLLGAPRARLESLAGREVSAEGRLRLLPSGEAFLVADRLEPR